MQDTKLLLNEKSEISKDRVVEFFDKNSRKIGEVVLKRALFSI